MAKVGDTVRYLNAVGGGIITRIDGKIAYVEEDGFENPTLISELVVTLPAGHKEQSGIGASLKFNQAAFDEGRKQSTPSETNKISSEPTPTPPAPETEYGEKLNVALAFEPSNLRSLAASSFNTVLVNDSNYYLSFCMLTRRDSDREWNTVFTDTISPNESIDITRLTHENLLDFEHIAIQGFAFKQNKPFALKSPFNIAFRLDLTKFHKLHCFRQGIYFDSPVIEIQLINDDKPFKSLAVQLGGDSNILPGKASKNESEALKQQLSSKYRIDSGRNKKQEKPNPADNPRKLLPLIEIDLHIHELTDTLAGLKPKDMLDMQLAKVRETMNKHKLRIGQKIVFIHGKGDGVLRKEVISLIKKEFPKATIQDASFQEYGFGASLITIL